VNWGQRFVSPVRCKKWRILDFLLFQPSEISAGTAAEERRQEHPSNEKCRGTTNTIRIDDAAIHDGGRRLLACVLYVCICARLRKYEDCYAAISSYDSGWGTTRQSQSALLFSPIEMLPSSFLPTHCSPLSSGTDRQSCLVHPPISNQTSSKRIIFYHHLASLINPTRPILFAPVVLQYSATRA
jgi:hypothetical protein